MSKNKEAAIWNYFEKPENCTGGNDNVKAKWSVQ